MRRPLTVNKPPAGISAEELAAWNAANKSVEESTAIAEHSARAELAILNSQPSKPATLGNIGSTPSPEGYVDESHQVNFRLTPKYTGGRWMLRLNSGGNSLVRNCKKTYGNFLSTQPYWEGRAAAAGFPNYVHDDTENDTLHCLITHDGGSVGMTSNKTIELRSLLSWYAGYEGVLSNTRLFLGQDFFPFRSGHVRCNDPLGKFPQYIQEHGPFAFMGNTQGTATTQLAIPPGRNKRNRLKNRGWLNVATECQTPEFQTMGRSFRQGNPVQGYANQWCSERTSIGAGRWCISGQYFANSVGTWNPLLSSQVGGCSDPRDFCNNIDPCYLPDFFSNSVPPGQATVLESEITPFRGLSQAEVEGDEKYRVMFWDWFLNSLGTRTDLFNRELPGMDKWTEASEWLFRTDLMKISWSRDDAVGGGYTNYRDLRNTPGYRNLTFDWKRGIKMPTLN